MYYEEANKNICLLIRAPIIYATMLAQSWIFSAFVDIYTFSIVIDLILEACFAVAMITSNAFLKKIKLVETWSSMTD